MHKGNMDEQENTQTRKRVRSVFNNHHICCADRDTSLAVHQENYRQTKHTNMQ